jgi:hypothetical protein
MWKDSIELKVIRLEGFPCSSAELALYVYFGDILHDQLLPITEEKSVLLSQEGTYRLEIINQNNQEEKSVSFQRNLFKEDGVRWIPLFSPHDDFLTEIPEDVPHPRILLIFYKKRMLSLKENEISVHEVEESKEEENYEINDEPLVSSVFLKNSGDDKMLNDYKSALEYERKLRDEQEKNLKKITNDLNETLERARVREDSLLDLITSKEEELFSAQNEIASLRGKIRKLEAEKNQLNDSVNLLRADKECSNIDGLRKELEMFTSYFKDCQKLSELKSRLDAYEAKDLIQKEQENSIENFFKGKKMEVKKDPEVVYSVNNRKVALVFKESIFFRSLGALQKFDEFLLASHERSLTPSNKFHRKNVSEFRLNESESKDSLVRRGNTPLNLRRK